MVVHESTGFPDAGCIGSAIPLHKVVGMVFRVCKVFEVASGHMLHKHPGRCRFPHGHTRRVEVVVSSDTLDANDMVCDFKALKWAVHECVDRLDHAMAINSEDPSLEGLKATKDRLVVFDRQDPTTEVLAKFIYEGVCNRLGQAFVAEGVSYHLPATLVVERVRVSETSTTWAEYARV